MRPLSLVCGLRVCCWSHSISGRQCFAAAAQAQHNLSALSVAWGLLNLSASSKRVWEQSTQPLSLNCGLMICCVLWCILSLGGTWCLSVRRDYIQHPAKVQSWWACLLPSFQVHIIPHVDLISTVIEPTQSSFPISLKQCTDLQACQMQDSGCHCPRVIQVTHVLQWQK